MASIVGMVNVDTLKARKAQASKQAKDAAHAEACKAAMREANDTRPLENRAFATLLKGYKVVGRDKALIKPSK